MTHDHRILVKLLAASAKMPTVANKGDLGYDVYSLEDHKIYGTSSPLFTRALAPAVVRTGISVEASLIEYTPRLEEFATEGLGLIVKDRSSMAMLGVFTHGGVIDAGYRG